MIIVKFQGLIPNKNLNVDGYKEILDYSINNDEILNIGVTGGYGTGKSSVIDSYLEKNKNVKSKSMQISLGSFSETENREINNVEEKIISQLINQIDKKRIPQSIFHKKDNYNTISIFLKVILLLILILSTVLIFIPDFITNLFDETPLSVESKWFSTAKWIIVLVGYPYLLSWLYKKQLDYRFVRKVSFYGSEIEMKDTEHSYFDKYTNDIIYLFINSKKTLFVFEDLDRFEKPLIYEKLVEVNNLINKRLGEKGKKITFMYLIRDDIFDSKERTKLFDILIPIIPVVVQGNSFDKFKELLGEFDLNTEFDDKVLRKLLFYIDDMRLLKNVLNEYLIYKKSTRMDGNIEGSQVNSLKKRTSKTFEFKKTTKTLMKPFSNLKSKEEEPSIILNTETKSEKKVDTNTLEINNNKLFALMVYKNLFPKDFHYFQYGISYIDYILNLSMDSISEVKEGLNEDVNKLEKLIEQEKKEFIKNQIELETLYFPLNKYRNLSVGGQNYNVFNNNYDVIKAIKDNDYVVQAANRQGHAVNNLEPVFEEIHEDSQFKERLERQNEVSKKLEEGYLETIKNLIRRKSTFDVTDYLNEQSEDFFRENLNGNDDRNPKGIDFEYLGESQYFDLLVFLLREELIDLRSIDLVSYFYDTYLTSKDRNFIRKVYDRKPIDYLYNVSNPELILQDIDVKELRNKGVLNHTIVMHCISNNIEVDIVEILLTIEDNLSANALNMVFQGDLTVDSKRTILELANKNDINFINIIINATSILEEKAEILLLILKEFETFKLELLINENVLMNEFMEIIENYSLTDNNIDKLNHLEERLQLLNIKFKDVSISNSKLDNLKLLYKHDIIEINYNNISAMMNENLVLFVKNKNAIYEYPFESITLTEDISFIDNIMDKNISQFLNSLIEILDQQNEEIFIKDEAKLLIKYLSDKGIEDDLLESFFNKTRPDSFVNDIKNHDDKDFIMQWYLYTPNTNNLLYIIEEFGFSSQDIKHIENNVEFIDVRELGIDDQKYLITRIFEENIFKSKESKLRKTIKSISHKIPDISLFNLDEIHLNYLVELKKIEYNEKNTNFILESTFKLREEYFRVIRGNTMSSEILYQIQTASNLSASLREEYLLEYIEQYDLNTLLRIIKYGELNLSQDLIGVLFKKKRRFPNEKVYRVILEEYQKLDLVTKVVESKKELIVQGRDITLKSIYTELDSEFVKE